MILKVLLILFSALALGQGTFAAPVPVQIRIHRHVIQRSWHVEYLFPVRGISQFKFKVQNTQFRLQTWKLLTADAELSTTSDGGELVRAKGGAGLTRVRFVIPDNDLPRSGYGFIHPYSDGSAMINTAYLAVSPLGHDFNPQYVFIPSVGEHIVSTRGISVAPVVLPDLQRETFVYFGKIRPIKTAAAIYVLDPNLPSWLVQKVGAFLPRIFSFYGNQLEGHLTLKPVVFWNYLRYDSDELGSNGQVLAGLMHLRTYGVRWRDPSRESWGLAAHVVSHEAAHFWNAGMFQPRYSVDNYSAWLHEGGAEAFSAYSLLALNEIRQERFLEIANQNLNDCVRGLEGVSLNDSFKSGKILNYYSCGFVISLVSVAGLKDGKSVFKIWRSVFAAAKRAGNAYDQNMFFDCLSRLGMAPDIVGALRTLTVTTIDNRLEFFHMLLAKVGIETKIEDCAHSRKCITILGI